MSVKKIGVLIGALLVAASLNFAQAATTDLRVAVVNVQQVLQGSPRVADLSKKLEAQFKDRQAKIGDEQKAMQDEMDKFKKESPTMSQKERDAMQKKITDDRANLVKQVVSYQQDLQKEQGKIMQNVLADLNSIVGSIAKSQNIALVLDAQAVIYTANPTDITKDVAKQFNAKQ